MRNRIIIQLFSLVLLPGCKKNIFNPISNLPASTFSQVFDEFWNQLNVNYIYWDIDTTNWYAMYRQWKPQFSSLQLDNTADLARSVGYFRKMTGGLIDHHFSITFSNAALKDSNIIDPANDRWRSDPAFRFPYSFLASDVSYLDSGFIYGLDNTTQPGNTLAAVAGTIHGDILFFTCNQFFLSASFQSPADNTVKSALNFFFGRLADASSYKAIVLDFRDNSGGDVADLNFLAGRFTSEHLPFGFTRNKSGNGRLDYTPWIGVNVSPTSGARSIPVPVVVLADKYSRSMAEIMTMAFRALPQCRVVGERTFGATGPFAENALYNGGPFDVPGFLAVTTSSVEFKYIDGKIYEGSGFPPDYGVPFNLPSLISGDDPQMNKALSLIK